MMLHKTKGSGEALFSLILVLFSAAAFWQSYGISGFGGLTTAGMFPMLASATMLAAASFVLSGAVRSLSESDTDDRPVTAHTGPVFSRELLLNQLYNDHRVVTDRTVDSHIKNLRRKLQQAAPERELIRSIYGVGYKLE